MFGKAAVEELEPELERSAAKQARTSVANAFSQRIFHDSMEEAVSFLPFGKPTAPGAVHHNELYTHKMGN